MRDSEKSKGQLIEELEQLRGRVSQIEKRLADDRKMLKAPWGSEEVLSAVFSSVMDGIVVTDLQGRIAEVNDVLIEYSGCSREEIIGKETFGFFTEGERDSARNDWMGLLPPGRLSTKAEYTFIGAGDERLPVEVSTSVIHDSFGNAFGFVSVIRNITKQQQVEHELKKKHDELQMIFDSVPALIYYKDRDGRILNMNKATASFTKVPKEKLLDKTVFQLMPDSADRYHKDDMEVITSGKAKMNIEEPLELPDKKRWLKTDKLPLKDEYGNVTGLIGFSVDITERKAVEEALRQSEEKLRVMFESMTDSIVIADLNGIVLDVNKAALKTFGYRKEDVVGHNGLDIIAFEDKERAVKNISLSVAGSEIIGVQEYVVLTKDGQKRSVEMTVNMLSSADDKPYGFITVIRDVTEKKKVEEVLKENERRYSSIFNNPLNMVFIHDENGLFMDANDAALDRLGYKRSDLGCVSFRDVIHPDDMSRIFKGLTQVIEKGYMEERVELRLISRQGEILWVEIYGFPIECGSGRYRGLGIAVEITERKKTEEALRKSEERYNLIAENMSDVIWIMDLNLNYQYVSPSIKHVRGFTVDEAMRMTVAETLSPESVDAARKRLAAEVDLEKSGGADPDRVTTMDLEARKKDGSLMWNEIKVTFLRDNDGKPIGLLGVSRDISERRRVEEALRESEEKLRVIFDSIGEAATVVDLHNNILDCNQEVVRLHGYISKSELIGRKASELVAISDRERAIADSLRALREPFMSERAEYRLVTKDGSEFDGEFLVSVLRDKFGKPTGFVGLAHDISERKRAAEVVRQNEEKLRQMFDCMTDSVVVIDKQLNIVDVNEAAINISGHSRDELIGRNGMMFLASPEDGSVDIFNTIARGGQTQQKRELMYVRPDDTKVNIEVITSGLRDLHGNTTGYINVVRDVTERKRIEEALRKSEEKYRDLVDKERDVIFAVDTLGFITSINPAVKGWGYSVEEVLGKNFIELIPEDWREKTAGDLQNALLASGEFTAETKVVSKSGAVLPVEYSAVVIREEGKYVGAQGVVRDISERKKAEEALRESEEKYRALAENTNDLVYSASADGMIQYVSPQVKRYGFDPADIKNRTILDLIIPEDRERIFLEALKTMTTGEEFPSQFRTKDAGGEVHWLEDISKVQRDGTGKIIGMAGVLRDITERKKAEVSLKQSEEKFRVLFESIPDGIIIIDLRNGKVADINPAALHISGYGKKEDVVDHEFLNFIAEKDRKRAVNDIPNTIATGSAHMTDWCLLGKGAKEIDCEATAAIIQDRGGTPTFMVNVVRDITERSRIDKELNAYRSNLEKVVQERTSEIIKANKDLKREIAERKRVEDELRASEEKLRIIFESIGDGILVTDLVGIVAECNEAAAKLSGYSDKSQLIGASGFDFVSENERGKMIVDIIKALKEQRNISVEYTVKDKVGREYKSEVNITLLRDASGSPTGIVSVIRDITERKRMEQELRDSEEMSRGMIESAATAICIVQDGKFQYVSPMFAEMTGDTVDELIGTVSSSYIHKDDRSRVMRDAVANMKGESTLPHEYRLLRKDGSFIWILEKIASIQYKGQRAAIGSLLDITRLKKVEEALRDSEEKLRLIFASLPDGVTVTDMNGKIVEENDAGVKLSGFTDKEQVIGLNGFDFIAEIDRDRMLADLPKILETGVSGPFEYKMVSCDGREYDGEVRAAMMRDKDGKPQGFIAVIRDVTERKKADQAFRESQEMMRGMLESAATGIYLVQDGKFEYVNPLFSGISGYTARDLLGSNSMSYIHPDDRENARMKAVENLKGISDLPHEFRFIKKDGQPTWILERVASIEYKGRRAAIGSFMDISERKRIEEELRKRSQELEQRTNQLLALQKVTASFQSTLELTEILQQVANGVVHNLGFDHVLIVKVDESAGVARGTVFATKEDAGRVDEVQEIIRRRLTEIEIPQIRGYSQAVDSAMDGKATVSHNFSELATAVLTPDEASAIAELLNVKTFVVMPLFARDRHVGSILVFSTKEEISNVLLEPLRILSDQAGVAIENADLYSGVSEYARRLSVISALSKILGSSLDIRGVYKAFTEEIKKVMDFDRASIAMVEGDTLRYFVVEENVETGLKGGAALPLGDSATGLVVKTKRTLIEPDFEQEMKFPIDHMYYRSGLRSAIRVPLFSEGKVFATFNLASKKPNVFGDREQEILEQVSGSLTAAIENSRLFDQVKQHENELVKAYEDLKSAQAYMLQAEKLRALGEMAGGVAHDFNNVLAVVLGRTQLALEDVKDEKLKKDLQIIEQTAMDAATTVRRLQDFARVRVERNFEVLDLKEVVESALQMAESRRVKLKEREGITIEIESKLRDTATIEGDAAELREGLLNIIFNAMDAMPEGGKISIEAKQTKEGVTIAISDTGIGIPENIRTKIFEPFFTTRTHKGTGLGLAVTYSIIQRHRGEIWVDSTVGVGSTFYIKLPLCEGTVVKKPVAGKAGVMKSVSILMVDDNPEVAGILGLTLKRLGHKVTEANSGEAAINTFEVGNYDLVITDLGMPDMSGHEVAKIVKEIKPGTPVLLISGWGGQLNLNEMPEVDGVIAKPFSKDVLSEKIISLLSPEGVKAKGEGKKAAKKKRISESVTGADEVDEGSTGKGKPKKKKRLEPDK